MKKTVLLVLLTFLIPAVIFGQTTFGFTGGVNFAKWSGDDAEFTEEGLELGPDNLMGFAGGVFANMKLGENLAFRPELLYTQKGTKYAEGIEGFEVEMKMKAAYIELPLLLQLNLSAGEGLGIFLLGGGSVAYNLSATMSGEVSAMGYTEDFDEDMKEEIKDIDYGVIFGAGVVINNSIEIVARYNLGLSSIADVDEEDLEGEDAPNVKNSAIEIRVGFRLSK